MKERFKSKKSEIIMLILFVVFYIFDKEVHWGVLNNFYIQVDKNMIDIFLSQLANSFLVVSLLMVLGNKEEVILWKDIVKMKLIEDQNWNFRKLAKYCFFTLGSSLVFVIMQKPSYLIFSLVLNTICLIIMTWKMFSIYYDRGKIENQIIEEFWEMSVEKQQKILYEFEGVISNNIMNKERDVCMKNIDFVIKVSKEVSLYCQATDILIRKLSEFTPYDSFFFLQYLRRVEKVVGLDERTEQAVRMFFKSLIKNNSGDFQTKKGLIEFLVEYLKFTIENFYSEDTLETIVYAALSSKAETIATKLVENKMTEVKQLNKMVDIIQYSYYQIDIDVIEIVLDSLMELSEIPYQKMSKYLAQYKWGLMDFGDLLELDVFGANEDEKKIILGILNDDENNKILTEKQNKKLRLIFFQEEYEPSDEEVRLGSLDMGEDSSDFKFK